MTNSINKPAFFTVESPKKPPEHTPATLKLIPHETLKGVVVVIATIPSGQSWRLAYFGPGGIYPVRGVGAALGMQLEDGTAAPRVVRNRDEVTHLL